MANAIFGSIVSFCTTPQAAPLANLAAYEALTFVQINGVGNMGAIGRSEDFLSFETWASDIVQHAKSYVNSGTPTLEVIRLPADAGQTALRAAALTANNYAFRVVRSDGSMFYNRGIVTGPMHPQGGAEDFDVDTFMIAYNDAETYVDPTGSFANWIFYDDTWNDAKFWQDGRAW